MCCVYDSNLFELVLTICSENEIFVKTIMMNKIISNKQIDIQILHTLMLIPNKTIFQCTLNMFHTMFLYDAVGLCQCIRKYDDFFHLSVVELLCANIIHVNQNILKKVIYELTAYISDFFFEKRHYCIFIDCMLRNLLICANQYFCTQDLIELVNLIGLRHVCVLFYNDNIVCYDKATYSRYSLILNLCTRSENSLKINNKNMRNLFQYGNLKKNTDKIKKIFINRDILELAVLYYRYTNFKTRACVPSIDSKVVDYFFLNINTHNVGELQIRRIQHTYEEMYKYISIEVKKLPVSYESNKIKHVINRKFAYCISSLMQVHINFNDPKCLHAQLIFLLEIANQCHPYQGIDIFYVFDIGNKMTQLLKKLPNQTTKLSQIVQKIYARNLQLFQLLIADLSRDWNINASTIVKILYAISGSIEPRKYKTILRCIKKRIIHNKVTISINKSTIRIMKCLVICLQKWDINFNKEKNNTTSILKFLCHTLNQFAATPTHTIIESKHAFFDILFNIFALSNIPIQKNKSLTIKNTLLYLLGTETIIELLEQTLYILHIVQIENKRDVKILLNFFRVLMSAFLTYNTFAKHHISVIEYILLKIITSMRTLVSIPYTMIECLLTTVMAISSVLNIGVNTINEMFKLQNYLFESNNQFDDSILYILIYNHIFISRKTCIYSQLDIDIPIIQNLLYGSLRSNTIFTTFRPKHYIYILKELVSFHYRSYFLTGYKYIENSNIINYIATECFSLCIKDMEYTFSSIKALYDLLEIFTVDIPLQHKNNCISIFQIIYNVDINFDIFLYDDIRKKHLYTMANLIKSLPILYNTIHTHHIVQKIVTYSRSPMQNETDIVNLLLTSLSINGYISI